MTSLFKGPPEPPKVPEPPARESDADVLAKRREKQRRASGFGSEDTLLAPKTNPGQNQKKTLLGE